MPASEPTYPFQQLCEMIPTMSLEEINATHYLIKEESDRYGEHDARFLILLMMHRIITLKAEIIQKEKQY